ncbi:hypothetical protein B0H13DRAFT_2318099 [Mycena leptocephala]|nr:hypothetical protein B0H13DRAFT_2318099 [Mycena leptocephala]
MLHAYIPPSVLLHSPLPSNTTSARDLPACWTKQPAGAAMGWLGCAAGGDQSTLLTVTVTHAHLAQSIYIEHLKLNAPYAPTLLPLMTRLTAVLFVASSVRLAAAASAQVFAPPSQGPIRTTPLPRPPNMPSPVLVFGATGAVGSACARHAHSLGATVTLAVRALV